MPAIRERKWDCPSCGSVGVLGRHKHCPNCGKSRGTTPTYLPENAPVVTDAGLLDLAHAGSDWNCNHCGSSNRGDSHFCTSCGAQKGSSPSNPVRVEPYGDDDAPVSISDLMSNDGDYPSLTSEPEKPKRGHPELTDWPSYPEKRKSLPRRGSAKLLVILLAVAVIGFLIFKAFQPYDVPVTVDQFAWSRVIDIQEYRTVREGDWSIPPNGRYVSQEQRVHHYVEVFDHYEYDTEEYACGSRTYTCGSRDLGNGFSEDVECEETTYCEREVRREVTRSEPVYQTWYAYDIDRWVYSHNVPTAGSNRNDPPPFWGNFTLNCANEVALGCERESARRETYTVTFVDAEGETYSLQETMDDWLLYKSGGAYTLVLNAFGIQNDPLRPTDDSK